MHNVTSNELKIRKEQIINELQYLKKLKFNPNIKIFFSNLKVKKIANKSIMKYEHKGKIQFYINKVNGKSNYLITNSS